MNQGVYAITHIETNKKYVGSSVALKRRMNRHRNELRKGIHKCAHLQRAWAKYGEEAFEFEIVELVNDCAILLSREQSWMDLLRMSSVLYNTCPKAGSPLGMKLTKEQRAKISEAHKGKKISEAHRAAMAKAAQKRIHTVEEIELWKNIWTGRQKTQSHQLKINEARATKWAENTAAGIYKGSKNPAAKACLFEGQLFGCLKDAMVFAGLSKHLLKKHPSFKSLA